MTVEELTLVISKLPLSERITLLETIVQSLKTEIIAPSSHEFSELLQKTRGVWRGGDGLKFQEQIRSEWENR